MSITLADEPDFLDVLRIWAKDWRAYERAEKGLMDRLIDIMSVVCPLEVVVTLPTSYEGEDFPYDAVIIDFGSNNCYIIKF